MRENGWTMPENCSPALTLYMDLLSVCYYINMFSCQVSTNYNIHELETKGNMVIYNFNIISRICVALECCSTGQRNVFVPRDDQNLACYSAILLCT